MALKRLNLTGAISILAVLEGTAALCMTASSSGVPLQQPTFDLIARPPRTPTLSLHIVSALANSLVTRGAREIRPPSYKLLQATGRRLPHGTYLYTENDTFYVNR